jgi:glycosyltransferase involved in cell wall biosynthesis
MIVRKRLLLLSHVLPFPPDSGVTSRTFNTVRQLQRVFDVTLLMFSRRNHQSSAAARQAAETALRDCVTDLRPAVPIPSQGSRARLAWDHARSVLTGRSYTYFMFESPEFGVQLRRTLAEQPPDIVHLESLDLHRWLPTLPSVPVTATHHDLESIWLQRRAERTSSLPLRRYITWQSRLAHRTEQRLCPQITSNVVMSDLDAERLQELAPGSRTIVIPNGVDTEFFSIREEAPVPGRVVFVGPTYLFPNRDAVDYLLANVWPRVRAAVPNATLSLIGGGPPDVLACYSREPGVKALGRVADLRKHVGEGCCSVVPIRAGGGTRIKILESWSMGRAVVSTSLGCEGLNASDGVHLLIRDDPEAFANAVIQLLVDESRRSALQVEASRLVESRFAWSSIGERLTNHYMTLIREG